MKVDVPAIWVTAAWNGWCDGQHDGMHGEAMASALAAVIPAIKAEALERAALIADEEAAYHYKAIPVENLTSDDPIACPAQQRMHVAETIAAAIRALMEPT